VPAYIIVGYGVFLAALAVFVGFWWRKGNIWRQDFGNWRKLPLSVRYLRGRQLMPGAGFLLFADGFLFIADGSLAKGGGGIAGDILLALFAMFFLLFFVCVGLCFTAMLFKWPCSLVPPWARDGKRSQRNGKRR